MVVSVSHEIGRVGLLERENATIMNACLRPLAVRIVKAFQSAMDQLAIDAPLYISQNDGTLMSAERAEQYPVATFASGPTNSMRGAAFLSDVAEGGEKLHGHLKESIEYVLALPTPERKRKK